jgi:hypothetical protein
MAAVSEILRFVLPSSQSGITAFSRLRQNVQTKGLARKQYFGYVVQNEGFPLPKSKDQICWYIGA